VRAFAVPAAEANVAADAYRRLLSGNGSGQMNLAAVLAFPYIPVSVPICVNVCPSKPLFP